MYFFRADTVADNEVFRCAFLNYTEHLPGNFQREVHSLFQGSAPEVCSLVGECREEFLNQIMVGTMDLNTIETALDCTSCSFSEVFDDLPCFFFCQFMKRIVDPEIINKGRNFTSSSELYGIFCFTAGMDELQDRFVSVFLQCFGTFLRPGMNLSS